MERKKFTRTRVVTWIVFSANLLLVFVSLTSIVFPALIIRTMGGFENYANVNPFETGVLMPPYL